MIQSECSFEMSYETCHAFPWWFNGKESACNAGATQMWVRSLGQEDPLKQEMAIDFCILAYKIPWTEESGRLQSTGSQRVGHN